MYLSIHIGNIKYGHYSIEEGYIQMKSIIMPAVAPWAYTLTMPVFTPDSETMASTWRVMS